MLERATHRPGASERWGPELLCDTTSKRSQSGAQNGRGEWPFSSWTPSPSSGVRRVPGDRPECVAPAKPGSPVGHQDMS